MHGSAPAWLQSFLDGRCQQVCYEGQLPVIVELLFGVPQGFVLGPILFLLYTAELFEVIASAGLTGHSYADDTQVYISAPASSTSVSVQRFVGCVERVDEWMKNSRLGTNADKTQLVWLGTRQQLNKLTTTDLSLYTRVKLSSTVLDLGVYIDSQLTTVDHIAALRRSCLYQLRQLRMIRSSLTLIAAKTLVLAFVRSRLDYCNSFLYGISDTLLAKLHTVQNTAARVIIGTCRKFDHITPVLRDLHWLPVQQRISFKLAMMVYKCMHGLAPSYLADICSPVSSVVGRWQLRSANSGTLVVPWYTRTTIGRRNFAVSEPATWNRLPVELRTSSLSIDIFAKKLKSHLFSCEHL